MQFRHLGRSGLRVSAIAYGNWLTHGDQIEEDTARACVRAALDAGITTYDTADVYAKGRAEQVLGRALAGERREGIEVFTKVFFPTGSGQNDSGLSRKHVLESIDRSLSHLGMDYVDLYQAHRYDHSTPLEETMLAFADVVRAGKALYIGVSEWDADQIRAGAELARELKIPFVSNQPQYSALYRVIEERVVPTCVELGLSQVVFSPIAQGVLSGKYRPGAPPPKGSRATTESGAGMISRYLDDEVLQRVQQFVKIAEGLGVTPAQLAIAWVLRNDNVAAAIVGASRPDQVADNVGALDVTVDNEVATAIDRALGDVVRRDPGLTRSPKERIVRA